MLTLKDYVDVHCCIIEGNCYKTEVQRIFVTEKCDENN